MHRNNGPAATARLAVSAKVENSVMAKPLTLTLKAAVFAVPSTSTIFSPVRRRLAFRSCRIHFTANARSEKTEFTVWADVVEKLFDIIAPVKAIALIFLYADVFRTVSSCGSWHWPGRRRSRALLQERVTGAFGTFRVFAGCQRPARY